MTLGWVGRNMAQPSTEKSSKAHAQHNTLPCVPGYEISLGHTFNFKELHNTTQHGKSTLSFLKISLGMQAQYESM